MHFNLFQLNIQPQFISKRSMLFSVKAKSTIYSQIVF